MSSSRTRPLSPHLSIWKWGPHMLVSILHRVCGSGLATVGVFAFVWWLVALASGKAAYANFHYYAVAADAGDSLGFFANILSKLVAIGLSWAFFQHLANGIRHFVLDTGAGYELKSNRAGALATIVISLALTVLMWAYLFLRSM